MRKLCTLLVMVSIFGYTSPLVAQAPLLPRDTTLSGPQTFAMIVGISKYRYIRPLNYADKDAELFRDYLKSPGGGALKDENIFCLLNERALNSVFWTKGFQWLKAKQLQKGDRLFIYLAGHGDAIDEDQYFFLTYDCNPGGDKNSYLSGGAIQLFNLKKKIAEETARGVDVFFIMDACRSNEVPGGTAGINFLNTAVSQKKVGEVMMLAAAAGQESLEDISIGNGHGLFTWYLVDGLTGRADTQKDNRITFSEIKDYVDKNVAPLALQRFRRKQEPYFCCNENSDKVIGMVDTGYFNRWIRQQQQARSGNSFSGTLRRYYSPVAADTGLQELYRAFNLLINRPTPSSLDSAEQFFQQMHTRFPNNPYTLDAQSSLAVAFINAAQERMNQYLDCMGDPGTEGKQSDFRLGVNLQKAIALVQDDEPDFAASLEGQLYFLKASGDFGPSGKNGPAAEAFQYAYHSKAIHPGGAYILNKLALLHWQSGHTDSAVYYAREAVRIAPKWACAATTLSLITKALHDKQSDANPSTKQRTTRKTNAASFGIETGVGAYSHQPKRAVNPNSDITGIHSVNGSLFQAGIFIQAPLGGSVSIRPELNLSLASGDLQFDRKPATGAAFTETISLNNSAAQLALPLAIHFSSQKRSPYFIGGPVLSWTAGQTAASRDLLPLKKWAALGTAGLGLDLPLSKAGLVLSPELRFTGSFTDNRDNNGTIFTNALTSLKERLFTFHLYLKKK